MYSFSYLEPVCCSMSSCNSCFLTCIQISQEAGQVVWYSLLFQNFPLFIVILTVKGFGIVNKAQIDVFLELSCFFHDPVDVGNLISGTLPFLKAAWTSRSSWFTYCWSLAWRILSILLHCLSLELEWKLTFSSPVATAEFPKLAGILSAALSQHHLSGFSFLKLHKKTYHKLWCLKHLFFIFTVSYIGVLV